VTIIPPSSVTAPGAPTAASGQPTAVLTQLPGAQPTPGTVITGTVIGRDNHGQMLLQTDAGVVAFKTAAALAVGSQVSLQIQAVGSQMQAVILSALAAGSKTPTGTTPGRTPTAGAAATAAPATTIATSVSTGSVLTATVIGPSGGPVPGPGGNPAPAPQAPTGGASNAAPQAAQAATGRPASGGAPPASTASTNPASTPSALVAQQAATPSGAGVSAAIARYAATPGTATGSPTPPPAGSPSTPAPAGTPAPNAPLYGTSSGQTPLQPASIGTTVQVRLAGNLPGSPPAGSTPVTGTVVAHTPNGQTLIDTPVGRLTVNLPQGAGHQSPGTPIALEIVSVGSGTVAPSSLALASSAAKALPTLGQDWPTLKAAMNALAAADPSFARQIMEVALPRLGTPRFLSQLLGQLVTGGGPADARALLGETAHALLTRAGHGDLLARLDAELREMSRLNSTPSDWRVIFLPIADMHELRQLRVYTRKKKDSKGKGKERSGRFIVEAEFEAYGPLQLDGLVQKPRIDLIVRSHVEFTPSLQAGIAEVFGRTCDASGLIGKIFFHAAPQFPVSPLDEIAQAGPGLSV